MTKDEIRALIVNTISGQGSQVDIGGKLAEVLSNIVNLIPEGGSAKIFPIVIHTEHLDGELSSYRCSHTYNEIVEALNDGYIVVANGTDDNGETVKNVATLLTSYDNYDRGLQFGYSDFNYNPDNEIEIEPL